MFLNKNFLILFSFLCFTSCEDLLAEDTSIDCEDEILTIDENGTSDLHTFVTTSVKFYLLTPSNETIEINSTNKHLVNTTKPTKLLIHGLQSYDSTTWVDQMAYVYHTKGEYNIIAVDWSEISIRDKIFVVSALDSVGNVVGNFIMDITEEREDYLEDVHLIGSSMGAQVSGAAGESVAKNGKKVGRITGLDPTVPEDVKILDETDADFVDVIHTNEVYGNHRAGTVDFYVFGDDPQHPVAINGTFGELLADDYYIWSIEDADRFQGISCYNASAYIQDLCDEANGVTMGEHVPRNATGSYLVSKNAASGLQEQGMFILSCTSTLILWYLLK